MNPQPPPHLAEPLFRLYERFIADAVRNWPGETEVPKSSMVYGNGARVSPNTFAARWRDAVASLRQYDWPSAVIDKPKFKSIVGQFVITIEVPQKVGAGGTPDASVWWKARGKKGRPFTGVAISRKEGFAVDAQVDRKPWENVSYSELLAVSVLIHNGKLTGPIIVAGQVEQSTVEELEGSHNVAFVFDEGKNITVIT